MRLIDADKLILHLNDYALQESPSNVESAEDRKISREVYFAIQNCMKAVEEQPTAFDVDKISKELVKQKKIVKIRASHLCCVCEKQVPKGERMLNQKAIVEGQGWRSCYICLQCVENWLEESGQVEDGGVNERNSF